MKYTIAIIALMGMASTAQIQQNQITTINDQSLVELYDSDSDSSDEDVDLTNVLLRQRSQFAEGITIDQMPIEKNMIQYEEVPASSIGLPLTDGSTVGREVPLQYTQERDD